MSSWKRRSATFHLHLKYISAASVVAGVVRGFVTHPYVVAHLVFITLEGSDYERITGVGSQDSALLPR